MNNKLIILLAIFAVLATAFSVFAYKCVMFYRYMKTLCGEIYKQLGIPETEAGDLGYIATFRLRRDKVVTYVYFYENNAYGVSVLQRGMRIKSVEVQRTYECELQTNMGDKSEMGTDSDQAVSKNQ